MSLPVFSLFPYSKKGDVQATQIAARIVSSVKSCRIGFMDAYFDTIIQKEEMQQLSDFISPSSTLIPLPKSAPLLDKALWPSRDICELLISKGLGREYIPMIKRKTAVAKAAYQPNADERPTVETHVQSMEIDATNVLGQNIQEIILVDDVVTQGRTAYAAYMSLQPLFPGIPVKLFTLVRTDSFKKIEQWSEPMQTEIAFYPASGKTFHKMDQLPPGGLWG